MPAPLLALTFKKEFHLLGIELLRQLQFQRFQSFRPGHAPSAVPAGRVVVAGWTPPLVPGISFLAAHKDRDAVVSARNDQLVMLWLQPRCAASAQSIGQRHRFNICPRVQRLEILPQRGAELIGTIVQPHLEKARFCDVGGIPGEVRDFALEHRAGQQGDSRRSNITCARLSPHISVFT